MKVFSISLFCFSIINVSAQEIGKQEIIKYKIKSINIAEPKDSSLCHYYQYNQNGFLEKEIAKDGSMIFAFTFNYTDTILNNRVLVVKANDKVYKPDTTIYEYDSYKRLISELETNYPQSLTLYSYSKDKKNSLFNSPKQIEHYYLFSAGEQHNSVSCTYTYKNKKKYVLWNFEVHPENNPTTTYYYTKCNDGDSSFTKFCITKMQQQINFGDTLIETITLDTRYDSKMIDKDSCVNVSNIYQAPRVLKTEISTYKGGRKIQTITKGRDPIDLFGDIKYPETENYYYNDKGLLIRKVSKGKDLYFEELYTYEFY